MNSPGSTSRTKLAPTMSKAAVSEATTQPVASLPRTRGRTPCGSRAANSVVSLMKVRQKAPRSLGSTVMATCSIGSVPNEDMSAVTSEVSLVESMVFFSGTRWSGSSSRSQASSSWVLVRLPLWASARPPLRVARKVGWALCHTEAPVVE